MHRPTARSLTLAILAATCADVVPAQNWTQATPAASPSIRRSGAMAFDPTAPGRVILYGGTTPGPGTILGETWAFTSTWTLLTPATTAGPRWGHRMVTDTQNNRLLSFGGRSPLISGF